MFIKNKIAYSKGFTIVELLIAMAGFSFILLLVTIVMINIGNTYSKGMYQSRIDDAARYIIEDITNQIKYNNVSSVKINKPAYCIGNVKYVATLYQAPTSSSTALSKSYMSPGEVCNATPSNGDELIPVNSSLSSFNITKDASSNVYTIQVSLYYGNSSNLDNYSPANYSSKCNTSKAYQYCAVTGLTTVVTTRVQ